MPLRTHDQLVELARILIEQARVAKSQFIREELTFIARGYQLRAAAMRGGKIPDIGIENLDDDNQPGPTFR